MQREGQHDVAVVDDGLVARPMRMPHGVAHSKDLVGQFDVRVIPVGSVLWQTDPMERLRQPGRHLAEDIGIDTHCSSGGVVLPVEMRCQHLIEGRVMCRCEKPAPGKAVVGNKTLPFGSWDWRRDYPPPLLNTMR